MLTESQSTLRCQHFRGRQNGHLEERSRLREELKLIMFPITYITFKATICLESIHPEIQFCFLGLRLTGYLVFVLASTYIYRSIIQVARLVVIAH